MQGRVRVDVCVGVYVCVAFQAEPEGLGAEATQSRGALSVRVRTLVSALRGTGERAEGWGQATGRIWPVVVKSGCGESQQAWGVCRKWRKGSGPETRRHREDSQQDGSGTPER